MNKATRTALEQYIKVADYLSAIQIYLQGNFFLEESLRPEHIKRRLLGHWGTCPGINFTYAHLNRAIIEHDLQMLFILGPGHGFPALQANLFLEKTLSIYDQNIPYNRAGVAHLAKQFSWPYGYPSHSNPEAPGVVLEGGELGYALSTAYGTVLDNPDLITACLVGDGEVETGPTATAWHLNKLLDPATCGAVLPILHLNGYKISGPTIFGRMNDKELEDLFSGYGYEPILVDAYTEADVHQKMAQSLDKAVKKIRDIQNTARKKKAVVERPRWPMLILRSPKGWHSIPELDGKRIEDNHYSHQVIAEEAKTNSEHLEALENWLRSYKVADLFSEKEFLAPLQTLVPKTAKAMGNNPVAFGGSPHYTPLKLPSLTKHLAPDTCRGEDPECGEISSMEKIGQYFRDVMEENSATANLRLFSPDETYSNKMDAVFSVTNRAFLWPQEEWDKDIAVDGRVMEMLSEHSLQGMLQGYLLTGRHGVFVSYEAFVQIVASMADQYAKFLSIAREVSFRGDIPSLNYILTSSGWRQEHNGFSHQNPGFIDGVLQRQGCFTNVYFPADANTALVAFSRMLESKNEINVLVTGKRPLPSWRTYEEAKQDIVEGINIWDFASQEDPHIVLASAGDYVTKETLAAVSLLREYAPELRVRYVNISSLSVLGIGCSVLRYDMSYYFTKDKPVRINFHGYPQTLKQILFDYGLSNKRIEVAGYKEVGSTTTPFDMMVRNEVDRYHTALYVIKQAKQNGDINTKRAQELSRFLIVKLKNHRDYIAQYGEDPEEIRSWIWPSHL